MPQRTTDPRLSDFSAYSKTQSNLSLKTAKDYVSDVAQFARFIEPTRLQNAQESHVVRFISDFHERGLKRGTIARRVFALRAFFQFLKRQGIRDDDPTENVSIPEEANVEERVVLTREEVRRALHVAGDRHVWRYPITLARDKALLNLFYSGLKRNEVVALNVADVNIEAKTCKSGRRVVSLNNEAIVALQAYLVARPKTKERALFLTIKGMRITAREAWAVAKNAGLHAGVDKPVSPESLRTAFAVHWIEEGRNPFDLAPILGIETSGIDNYAKLAQAGTADTDAFTLTGLTDVVFDQLDMRRTKFAWHKILQRVQSDPEGAITQTRTLLETICKHILSCAGAEMTKTENLSGLSKRALSVILPARGNDDHWMRFTRIAAGLIDQLSTYRNARGDAHASASERSVEQHQARYAVGLAAATAGFLVHCFMTYRATNDASIARSDIEKVLPLSRRERELLCLLLETASRSADGDKRDMYRGLLRRTKLVDTRSTRGGHQTYVHMSGDEVSLLRDLLLPGPDFPKEAASVVRRVGEKVSRLTGPAG